MLKLSCSLGSGDPGSPESKRERNFRVIFATVARNSMFRGGGALGRSAWLVMFLGEKTDE